MSEPFFFAFAHSPTVGDIAELVGATFDAATADRRIDGLAPIESAGPRDLAYFDNPKYLPALKATRAAACLLRAPSREKAPAGLATLVVENPRRPLNVRSKVRVVLS